MKAPSSTPTFTLARALRVVLGVTLTAILTLSVLIAGADMGENGGWWVVAALGSSLCLLLAAVGNWRLLWNAVGQVLRALLGERGARVAMGVVAVAFAVGAMVSSAKVEAEVTTIASATATK